MKMTKKIRKCGMRRNKHKMRDYKKSEKKNNSCTMEDTGVSSSSCVVGVCCCCSPAADAGVDSPPIGVLVFEALPRNPALTLMSVV
jgi:hypothetical protein